MTIDTRDARLTAYALGELTDAEREAFELEIADDEEAQREIGEISALAALLQDELGREPAPETSAEAHEVFLAGLDADASPPQETAQEEARGAEVIPFPWWKVGVVVGAAASVLLVLAWVGGGTLQDGQQQGGTPMVVAEKEQPPPGKNGDVEKSGEIGWNGNQKVPEVLDPSPQGNVAQAAGQSEVTGGVVALNLPATTTPTVPRVPSPDEPAPPDGKLTIHTIPPGTKVLVDGRQAAAGTGSAPMQQGQYHVVVQQPGHSANIQGLVLADSDEDGRIDVSGDASGRWSGAVPGGSYAKVVENDFKDVRTDPLSTFSIDVDTASYSNVRRFLRRHTLPPVDAVRIEEMINYFDYDYAPPTNDDPFAVHMEVADSPFDAGLGDRSGRRLVRIGLKGREIHREQRPVSNLVFLLDVSGSMEAENKLPLLKASLAMLVEQLSEKDRVAIVVYAGASGLVLPSTPANRKDVILKSLDRLNAGGSTNGGAGIELAYRVAVQNFVPGGTNRVILATDGDFNVGVTQGTELQRLIEDKARTGVFLSVLGFGMDDLNDQTLETLADKGNGNYAIIDTRQEAEKVLVEQLSGTLVTIASDVKIQVEFNPAKVQSYRLIGYSNRMLAAKDFNDDTKDAGEIGAGHSVTALYEVIPALGAGGSGVDPLKYQQPSSLTPAAESKELLTVKLRFKQPDGDTSTLRTFPLEDERRPLSQASADLRFATAVAMYGHLLSGSAHQGTITWEQVRQLAQGAVGRDAHGYRREFLALVDLASALGDRR